MRANLVRRAEQWAWSSAAALAGGGYRALLDAGPVPRSADWLEWVNCPQSAVELAALRKYIQRGTPYGSQTWQHATARRLGL